jgi:hypothetical protein
LLWHKNSDITILVLAEAPEPHTKPKIEEDPMPNTFVRAAAEGVPAAKTNLPKAQVEAFIQKIMEPLVDDLTDTHYNGLMRQARVPAWRKALYTTKFVQAKSDMLHATDCFQRFVERGEAAADSARREYDENVERLRAAIARQILTPAPQKADVEWKRKAATDRYLPISAEQIQAAIDADENFLRAHPTKRSRGNL